MVPMVRSSTGSSSGALMTTTSGSPPQNSQITCRHSAQGTPEYGPTTVTATIRRPPAAAIAATAVRSACVVPNEIKKYVLGYYGALLAPIEPELRATIIANGASNIALEPAAIQPMLPDLRRRHPDESIDLLLLRAMFAGTQVDEMKRTVAAGGNPDERYGPVLGLVKSLHRTSASGRQSLTAGALQITLDKLDPNDDLDSNDEGDTENAA